jgi:hypothetical protein
MDNSVSIVFKVAKPEIKGIKINPAYDHLKIQANMLAPL